MISSPASIIASWAPRPTALGSTAIPTFVAVPIKTTLSNVPMPGRSPSGHHRRRIGIPRSTLIVPIS